MAKYEVGTIVKGQVTGIENYGAFIKIDDEYTGLVHISEVANNFVKSITKYLKVGDFVYCEVLAVDEKNLQVKLSIKNISYKVYTSNKVKESTLGFLPLKNNLNKWIVDKISEINNDNAK